MALPLGDRLSTIRHARFVGRSDELELFHSVLARAELPFQVLYIFGPGGVGKTALLGEFAYRCAEAQVVAIHLDARNFEPSPESFLSALCLALGLTGEAFPLHHLSTRPERHILLIDTYEKLAPLDAWLRDTFLPQLPQNVLAVLAGRNPPSLAWRADPGWQTLMLAVPLRNLSPEESRAYLAKREIPFQQHQAITQFTYGHPLALSLVADLVAQRGNLPFHPEAAPDVVQLLLEQLVEQVPGPAHRRALEACAMVRLTTEGLLAELLAMPDVNEVFEWLRALSLIESGPLGIFPHDLARAVLAADLRWRNPDWYAELHRRARTYYARRLQQTAGQEQQRILFDYVFLHRDNSVVRPLFDWQDSGTMLIETARDGDWPALLEMVARHEGEESARLAANWFARQPQGVLVVRDGGCASGGLAGFIAMVALHQASDEDVNLDPGTGAAWHYLQHHAPLRPGEGATVFRFWMARDTYQAVSATQSRLFVNAIRHCLVTRGLAFSFFPCAAPDFWMVGSSYLDLVRIEQADFRVGGRPYGVYGHDWRATPPMAWLAMLAEREITYAPRSKPSSPLMEPLVVLSQADFAAAVRDALRHLYRTRALESNPLLRSRMVAERAGTGTDGPVRITALQDLLKEAVESLLPSPQEARLHRALYYTYFRPAPSQERAAEQLDLPFSTFRRHLNAGIARVTEILWQKEIRGLDQWG